MTSEEIKKCMKTREPIEGYYDQCREWCKFAYIDSVISRYNADSGKFDITVVLMDKNLKSTYHQTPDKLRRITSAAAEPDAKSEEEVRREIQQRTLETIREAAKRHKR